jgi:hypothetical protein
MSGPSELKFINLAACLRYWGADSPDSPIALVIHECCKRFVCMCAAAEHSSPSGNAHESSNGS